MKANNKEINEICNLLTTATRPISNTNESFGNTEQLSSKSLQLEQDREILKSFIVRHHPEMEGWIRKNFGREK